MKQERKERTKECRKKKIKKKERNLLKLKERKETSICVENLLKVKQRLGIPVLTLFSLSLPQVKIYTRDWGYICKCDVDTSEVFIAFHLYVSPMQRRITI